MPRESSTRLIREFLLANIGTIVDSKQIRDAAGARVSEWARRVRELREAGWPIETHHDRDDLKPGQYLLTGLPPARSAGHLTKGISARLRAQVLDRDGFTCQMCGKGAGDLDTDTGRKVRLHIGHIMDKSIGGKDEMSNLRALCSTCNQGAKNLTGEKPGWVWLLQQIRRSSISDQRAALDWLKKKFGE